MRKNKPIITEAQLQIACVKFFRKKYSNFTIFAIPNGGDRRKIEASQLRYQGVTAGTSDLFISAPSRGFSGFYIEMKKPLPVLDMFSPEWQRNAEKIGRLQVLGVSYASSIPVLNVDLVPFGKSKKPVPYKSRLSDLQLKFASDVISKGYYFEEIYSLQGFIDALQWYLG